ncbi:hypothetical protein X988_5791 [Burkholderia pseudomallei TSV 48]|nr:hypothetical protein X988_5791 [Burkholderia pseudomallei TSV 48]
MDITRRSLLGAALAGALDTIAPAAHAQAAARGAAPRTTRRAPFPTKRFRCGRAPRRTRPRRARVTASGSAGAAASRASRGRG